MQLKIDIKNLTEHDWRDIKAIIDTQFTSDREQTNNKFSNGSIDFHIKADYYDVNSIKVLKTN